MNTKTVSHTPGPWRVEDAGPNSGNVIRFEIQSDAGDICDIEDPAIDGNPNAEANAQLIAAAPELLEACKAAELARQSIERNMSVIKRLLHQKGLPITWLDGVIRGLEHSRVAISKVEARS